VLITFGIVNFKSTDKITDLIESIENYMVKSDYRIVIFDNSNEMNPNPKYHLLASSENIGYAAAVNRIKSYSATDQTSWLWMVNPDTYFIAPLSNFLEQVKADNLAHPWTVYTHHIQNIDGSVWFESSRFNSFFGTVNYEFNQEENYINEVKWIPGTSLLIPPTCVSMTNGFDEMFFLYREELDWILTNTLRCVVVSELIMKHHRGFSTRQIGANMEFLFDIRNHWLMSRKQKNIFHRISWKIGVVFRLLTQVLRFDFRRFQMGLAGVLSRDELGKDILTKLIKRKK
jgi:GT2 family glycosyltransferase